MIECRRILKWTYAYGYYSFADEEDDAMAQRRQFFEFLQGDAERILDQARHTHDEGGIRVSGADWMCTRGRASSSVHPQSSSHPLPPALCPVMLVCVYVCVCVMCMHHSCMSGLR